MKSQDIGIIDEGQAMVTCIRYVYIRRYLSEKSEIESIKSFIQQHLQLIYPQISLPPTTSGTWVELSLKVPMYDP